MADEKIVQLLEKAKSRLLRELELAYEEAGMQGLCGEGRWEYAIGRVRELDLSGGIAEESAEEPAPRRDRGARRRR